jgi:uncharacterized protein
MDQAAVIRETAAFIHEGFKEAANGHDWWHVYRVWKMATRLAEEESGADLFVVELGALLHDIADWKFHDADLEAGPRRASEWLSGLGVDPDVRDKVVEIVRHVSFRGGTNKHEIQTLEGKIVQDADRLDAVGAIGIARAFAYGGSINEPMYDPARKPQNFKTFEEFKNSTTTTVNHFYEKLLKLKDRLNTNAARRVAQHRHTYVEQFLEEFYAEWEGER